MSFIDVDDLNYDIYFEFYLENNLFYRYNYVSANTEFSLYALSGEITHQLISQYQFKIFTGFTYDETILIYGIIVSENDHCIMDVGQALRYATDFPLNLVYNEEKFIENLYINMILMLSEKIESSKFRELLFTKAKSFREKTINPIWPVFYNDDPAISLNIGRRIQRLNNRILQLKQYTNNDFKQQIKFKLLNDLIKFNEVLDRKIEKTLSLYRLYLEMVHRENMNRLREGHINEYDNIVVVNEAVLQDNSQFIQFCYGDTETLPENQCIEYIKYFVYKFYLEEQEEIDLGRLNAHYRSRYNLILDLKGKIADSILIEIEKLTID